MPRHPEVFIGPARRWAFAVCGLLLFCGRFAVADDAAQRPLALVEQMPNVPRPFLILDW
jgi:hypothetical protein